MSSTLFSVATISPPAVVDRDSPSPAIVTSQDNVVVRSKSVSLAWACAMPVIVGLAVRLFVALVWLQGTEPFNDGADYFSEATKLHNGTREAIPFYWPPGTSYYLAAWFAVLGPTMTAARMAMVVLSTVQIAIVAALTFQATQQRRVAVLSAWLWALYPPAVLLVFQPYSQHLAALSLAAIALCGIGWLKTQSVRWLLSLGVCLGIGCLARPSMMSVVLVSACCPFVLAMMTSGVWWKRILNACGQSLLLCAVTGAVVAPTILHNARTGGGYSLSTNNERNFFLGNNPHTPWYKTSHFAQRTLDELPPEIRTYLLSEVDPVV